MTVYDTPKLPIPEPLRGSDPGSFAERTVKERLPNILRTTLELNPFHEKAKRRLEKLIQEIPYATIRQLGPSYAPDLEAWRGYIRPHLSQNWLEAPWFFVENYMYRRVLEATNYFERRAGRGIDPFQEQKERELQANLPVLNELAEWINQQAASWKAERTVETLAQALVRAVWGNQGDLSMWPGAGRPDLADDSQASRLLVNDAERAARYLFAEDDHSKRVDFINDNVGEELLNDLVLADLLLTSGKIAEVRFHTKAYPTFVSDALPKDVLHTFEVMQASDSQQVRDWVGRLNGYQEAGRLRLREHFFWNTPLAGWEMPPRLKAELGEADLILSKGDANYRRFVGDRHWEATAPLSGVLRYLPAPFLAVRVLKAEVLVGVPQSVVENARSADPDYLSDGRWGVIQFAPVGHESGDGDREGGSL